MATQTSLKTYHLSPHNHIYTSIFVGVAVRCCISHVGGVDVISLFILAYKQ